MTDRTELEEALELAKSTYQEVADDIERVKRISTTLKNKNITWCLTKEELQELKESYSYHKGNLYDKTVVIAYQINKAKELWTEKQSIMKDLHEQGILDAKVTAKWNRSLNTFVAEIDKLDEGLRSINS